MAGRSRSPDSIKAERMYRDDGMALVDIAKKLGVPAGTVRRWKSTQKWDDDGKKKQSERSDKRSGKGANGKSERSQKKKEAPKHLGAPFGNHNARGHGAPKGNKNNYKHGVYSNPYWEFLDEEEKAVAAAQDLDEEARLEDSILFYMLRERRIMAAINKIRSGADVVVDQVQRQENKRTFANEEEEERYNQIQEEKIKKGDILPGKPYSLLTVTANKDRYLTRWEQELSQVQRLKDNAIVSLAKIRSEKHQAEESSGDADRLKLWVEKIQQTRAGNTQGMRGDEDGS